VSNTDNSIAYDKNNKQLVTEEFLKIYNLVKKNHNNHHRNPMITSIILKYQYCENMSIEDAWDHYLINNDPNAPQDFIDIYDDVKNNPIFKDLLNNYNDANSTWNFIKNNQDTLENIEVEYGIDLYQYI
jgi:acyl-CoA-binding protein